jgi:hypothetical protein
MTKLDPLAADPVVIETYAEALKEHGAGPEALGWTKPEKMPMRYEALCGGFKPESHPPRLRLRRRPLASHGSTRWTSPASTPASTPARR